MTTIIRGATVITMTGDAPTQLDVLIKDSRIVALGDLEEEKVDQVIDGHDHVLLPGLINAHTHMAMSLFRNYAEGLPLFEWLSEKIWPAEAKLTDEDIYQGTLLAIAESLRSGVTCFNDMYFGCEEVVRAVKETGIRGVIARGVVGGDEVETKIAEAVALIEAYHGKEEGRLQIQLAPHAPYTCDRMTLERMADLAKEHGVRLHIHVAETKREVEEAKEHFGMSPVAYLDSLGFFDAAPVVMAHGVHVSDADLDRIAKKDVHLVHNPESNLKLASGFCPITKYLEKGINVALGTDGASSNNNLNLFEEMHVTALLHKALSGDATKLSPMSVLEMATINGARALGIDHLVGTIEVGKRADLIMVDLHKPHIRPVFDPAAALVYSAQSADIDLVMVDGRVLLAGGTLTSLDEEKVLVDAEKAAFDLIRRAKEGS